LAVPAVVDGSVLSNLIDPGLLRFVFEGILFAVVGMVVIALQVLDRASQQTVAQILCLTPKRLPTRSA
jgi:hypothetical protein